MLDLFKKKQHIVYGDPVTGQLLEFLERVEYLERESSALNNRMNIKTMEWDSELMRLQREVRLTKGMALKLKDDTSQLKVRFINVVNDFRTKTLKEDFEKVAKRVENLHMEDMLTKEEFLALGNSPK